MKITPDFSFSEIEKKILKKAAILSTIFCILIVIVAWTSQSFAFKQLIKPKNDGSQGSNLLPIDIEAHKNVAFRFIKNGKPQKAIPHLQRILSINSSVLEINEKLAQAYLEAGHYTKALTQFNYIIANFDSADAETHAKKGITLYYLGNITESKSYLENCLSRFPNSVETYCFLGQIEASCGNSEKAHNYLQKAISLDSSYIEAWYQLARYKMELKEYKSARLLLINILDLDPLHAKSHSRLGMIYYYLENPKLAKKSYQTALALNPEDFNTHYNFGELYLTMFKDTVNALKEYRNTLKFSPFHTDANFKIGLICFENKMYKEAILHFEKALESDNSNLRILLQLAVGYENIGNIKKARSIYEQITKIDELNVIARQKLRFLTTENVY